LYKRDYLKAWLASALTIVGATFYGVIGLFPNMFPSSIDAQYSLTAYNASSSPLTLKIMLIVVLIFIPIVIGYQIWAYKLFSGKIGAEDLDHEEAY
jgi:cytochrome d ubiquinol oxidase subunit II